MIKINLVPVKEKKKRKEIVVVFSLAGILIVFAVGLFWFYLQKKIVVKNLEKEIAQIEEESKAYEEKIKEIKDLEAKEATLATFKGTIKNISEKQRKVTVAVDQYAANLPDGVWITRIAQGAGNDSNKFIVGGYSFAQSGLKNYFEAIQKPGGFFKDAVLDIRGISAAVGTNRQIHQFEISARVLDQGP